MVKYVVRGLLCGPVGHGPDELVLLAVVQALAGALPLPVLVPVAMNSVIFT